MILEEKYNSVKTDKKLVVILFSTLVTSEHFLLATMSSSDKSAWADAYFSDEAIEFYRSQSPFPNEFSITRIGHEYPGDKMKESSKSQGPVPEPSPIEHPDCKNQGPVPETSQIEHPDCKTEKKDSAWADAYFSDEAIEFYRSQSPFPSEFSITRIGHEYAGGGMKESTKPK